MNDKVEGFFELCAARGLTGDQGVLLPAPNARQLMLRRDVIDAVAEGRFHVYASATVDQGAELLMGVAIGERDATGRFPPGSIGERGTHDGEARALRASSLPLVGAARIELATSTVSM